MGRKSLFLWSAWRWSFPATFILVALSNAKTGYTITDTSTFKTNARSTPIQSRKASIISFFKFSCDLENAKGQGHPNTVWLCKAQRMWSLRSAKGKTGSVVEPQRLMFWIRKSWCLRVLVLAVTKRCPHHWQTGRLLCVCRYQTVTFWVERKNK